MCYFSFSEKNCFPHSFFHLVLFFCFPRCACLASLERANPSSSPSCSRHGGSACRLEETFASARSRYTQRALRLSASQHFLRRRSAFLTAVCRRRRRRRNFFVDDASPSTLDQSFLRLRRRRTRRRRPDAFSSGAQSRSSRRQSLLPRGDRRR